MGWKWTKQREREEEQKETTSETKKENIETNRTERKGYGLD